MASPMLAARCVVPLFPAADDWYVVGMGSAVLLFVAASALLWFLRGWRWRSIAGVPLLVGIWCLLLAFWVQTHPRTFLFRCSLGTAGGLVETSSPLVRASGTVEAATDWLVLAVLVGAALVVMWQWHLRRAVHARAMPRSAG